MVYNKALFAAGCFWGVEKKFSSIQGVMSTKVGYTGGTTKNPTYEEVCTNQTGHAEAVLIDFDSNITSFDKLLIYFWECHDPTTLNRQGLDIGSQYRSSIFFMNLEQKRKSIESKEEIAVKYDNPVVTEILEAQKFYLAEEYHQKYLEKKAIGIK